MAGFHVVFVTCALSPDLSASDELLALELRRRGHAVTARPWNQAPITDFTRAGIVLLRSNWDFHYDLVGFETWLSTIEASAAELHNPAGLVRAHNTKSTFSAFRHLAYRHRTPSSCPTLTRPRSPDGWTNAHIHMPS